LRDVLLLITAEINHNFGARRRSKLKLCLGYLHREYTRKWSCCNWRTNRGIATKSRDDQLPVGEARAHDSGKLNGKGIHLYGELKKAVTVQINRLITVSTCFYHH